MMNNQYDNLTRPQYRKKDLSVKPYIDLTHLIEEGC